MYKQIDLPYDTYSGLLTNAFLKGLFIKPDTTDFYLDVKYLNTSSRLDIYPIFFEESYYYKLIDKIESLIADGEFERSNSNYEWMMLYNHLKDFRDVDLEAVKSRTRIDNHPFHSSFK